MSKTWKGNKVVRVCKSCGRGLSAFEPDCSVIEENESTMDRWF